MSGLKVTKRCDGWDVDDLRSTYRITGKNLPAVYVESGVHDRELAYLLAASPDLKEAATAFVDGWEHFCSRINFGASFLDAKSIRFMNEIPLAFRAALAKCEPPQRANAEAAQITSHITTDEG